MPSLPNRHSSTGRPISNDEIGTARDRKRRLALPALTPGSDPGIRTNRSTEGPDVQVAYRTMEKLRSPKR